MGTVTRRRDNRGAPQSGDRKAGVSSRRFASQKRSSGGIRDQAQCRFCKRGDKYNIKEVGTHSVTLRFAPDLTATVSVVVVARQVDVNESTDQNK